MAVSKPRFASLLCLLAVGLGGADAGDRLMSRPCNTYGYNSLKNRGPIDGVYNFSITDIHGSRNISLSEFRGKQEPGANATEIFNGIKHVRPGNNFTPNFTLTAKTDVNGANEHPLYTFLKSRCPPTRESFSDKNRLFYTQMKNSDIRWNWEKFLVGPDGQPCMRYDPSTEPHYIQNDISNMLQERQ